MPTLAAKKTREEFIFKWHSRRRGECEGDRDKERDSQKQRGGQKGYAVRQKWFLHANQRSTFSLFSNNKKKKCLITFSPPQHKFLYRSLLSYHNEISRLHRRQKSSINAIKVVHMTSTVYFRSSKSYDSFVVWCPHQNVSCIHWKKTYALVAFNQNLLNHIFSMNHCSQKSSKWIGLI